ncbi:MAG TPA: sucrase ferredoxin [Pyrinomonadaceae bacterium]|nr:sucrase ferredoxin [Pyrinomonadaceae bacterium]
MTRTRFFCSELSRRAGERVYGTASTGAVWLLVEYPFPWGSKALEESNLTPAIKARVAALLKGVPGSRLLFVKRGAYCAEKVSAFAVRCRDRDPFAVRFDLEDYRDLPDLDLPAVAAGRVPAGGRRLTEPLFLVCTHGKRDKCCAKYGNALYKHLSESYGESVWQSSHVGGDRFAANLVCFPHGVFYAHTTDEDGTRAVEEYRAGRLVLDKYRGRACYPQHVQAAEYFTRVESGLKGLADLRALRSEKTDEQTWRAAFHAPDRGLVYEATVTSHPSEFANPITCHSADERPVPQFHLDSLRTTAYSRAG